MKEPIIFFVLIMALLQYKKGLGRLPRPNIDTMYIALQVISDIHEINQTRLRTAWIGSASRYHRDLSRIPGQPVYARTVHVAKFSTRDGGFGDWSINRCDYVLDGPARRLLSPVAS